MFVFPNLISFFILTCNNKLCIILEVVWQDQVKKLVFFSVLLLFCYLHAYNYKLCMCVVNRVIIIIRW